jgi:four helix bundle protein
MMENFSEKFKQRTKVFALAVIKLYRSLPKTGEARVIGNQFLRSGTSVAANYRAATRASSGREFFAKICIVIEEADETLFWLELLKEAGISNNIAVDEMIRESSEILKIVVTTRQKLRTKK